MVESSAILCTVKPEDVHHIMSSIQAAAAVLALIAAGLWALNKWYRERQPSLDMTVTARQDMELSKDTKGFIIRGEVEVTNRGNASTLLNLGDGPLFVARVQSLPYGSSPKPRDQNIQDGKMSLSPTKKFWLSRPTVDDPRRPDIETYNRIPPAGRDVFHFMIKVEEPGTYAILFSAKMDDRWSRSLEGKTSYPARWEPPVIFVDVRATTSDAGSLADQEVSYDDDTIRTELVGDFVAVKASKNHKAQQRQQAQRATGSISIT